MARKIQPWPWRVEFLQYSQSGKHSRPRIVDANGKTVSMSSGAQATLMAMAPLLLDRLKKLENRAESLHLQLQSALGFNMAIPKELVEAAELLKAADWALRSQS